MHHYWEVAADRWLWQNKRHVFWPGKDQVTSGCQQHGVRLKLNFKVLSVSPPSLFLTICALSTLKSFLGDCAVNLSQAFITATWPGRIIYSSSSCSLAHITHLYKAERVCGVSWGGWKSGKVVWFKGRGIWIFHCFQQFLRVHTNGI